MPTTTRGSLPPGVYWRRRLALLTVAVVLVLLIGKLLGAGGGATTEGQAQQVGAPTSPTATVTVSDSPTAAAAGQGKKGKKGRKNRGVTETPTPTPTPTTPPPLAEPSGPCAADDVFMTPSVASAVGGSDVSFLLNFQTSVSEACTFDLSPDSVRVKIAKGRDTVWQSSQCPSTIPTQEIVVRRTTVTQVPMTWHAKRSDETCSDRTAWVLPDVYTISSSVLGGEPTVVDFDLATPAAPVVTETVHPTIPATTSAPATPAAPPAG